MLIILLFSACVTAPVEKPEVISPEEQRRQESIETFNEILDVLESTNDRKAVLPQVEGLYKKIINEYPETALAQESYWRLISIYVNDYSPPDYEKSSSLYGEFLEKYPQSMLKGFVQDTLGKSYYKDGEWDQIINLISPAIKEYTEKGKLPAPSLVSMYAEANYRTDNFDEAEKSYKILIKLYPKLIESIKARARLKELRMRFK